MATKVRNVYVLFCVFRCINVTGSFYNFKKNENKMETKIALSMLRKVVNDKRMEKNIASET